jgi:hypothetical protein
VAPSCVDVMTTNEYGPGMFDDPRMVIPVRLRASSVARLDEIAAAHDWSRSDAMRYLFRLGLAEHDRATPRQITVDKAAPHPGAAPASPPAPEDFATRHARLNRHRKT